MNMMSSPDSGKAPATGVSLPSIPLKDLPCIIAAWMDLCPIARRDRISAVRTVLKLWTTHRELLVQEGVRQLELAPELMADCAQLNGFVFSRKPRVFGISPRRLENVLSLLRDVLRRLGLHANHRFLSKEAPPVWQAISTGSKHSRDGLTGFAIWCADRDVLPDKITPEILHVYRDWRVAHTLKASAAKADRHVVRAWQAFRVLVPDWPPLLGVLSPSRQPYTPQIADCAASFQDDVASFERRALCVDASEMFPIGCDDPASDRSSRRRPARPGTVATRVFQIRQSLGALVQSGVALEEIRFLRDLVEPIERPQMILKWFYARSARKTGSNIGGVAEMLRQLAKFHCQLPEDACRRISAWAVNVRGDRNSGMIPKNRARLRSVTEERSLSMLLHCPAHLMKAADKLPAGDSKARRLARAAVALEILLICPMRVGNLRVLRLGEHLQRGRAGSLLYTSFEVPEYETKNRSAISWPIPTSTARLIAHYLRRHRLSIENNDHLFAGEGGRGVASASTINATITKTIAEEIGVEINPHLLRHFAAYLYLRTNQGAYELVRRVLGHKDIDTTVRFYCGLETEFAAQHFDETVLRHRSRTRATAAASFGRLGKGR